MPRRPDAGVPLRPLLRDRRSENRLRSRDLRARAAPRALARRRRRRVEARQIEPHQRARRAARSGRRRRCRVPVPRSRTVRSRTPRRTRCPTTPSGTRSRPTPCSRPRPVRRCWCWSRGRSRATGPRPRPGVRSGVPAGRRDRRRSGRRGERDPRALLPPAFRLELDSTAASLAWGSPSLRSHDRRPRDARRASPGGEPRRGIPARARDRHPSGFSPYRRASVAAGTN